MPEEKFKHFELTGKIIGASMEVHKLLGSGFQEVIYQRALEREFNNLGLSFEREKDMPIYYKGEEIGMRRVDFLVHDVVSVEIKAVTRLEEVHMAQGINYLEAYDIETGLLLNFGAKSLEVKRLINNKFKQKAQREV